MNCAKCGSPLVRGSTDGWNEGYNFGKVLPKDWLQGIIRWDCNHSGCYHTHIQLKDGSVYVCLNGSWVLQKRKVTRIVPREQIIGGYFVQ